VIILEFGHCLKYSPTDVMPCPTLVKGKTKFAMMSFKLAMAKTTGVIQELNYISLQSSSPLGSLIPQ
jgi:hypothetical protein